MPSENTTPTRTPETSFNQKEKVRRTGLEIFVPKAFENLGDLIDSHRVTEDTARDAFFEHAIDGCYVESSMLPQVLKTAMVHKLPAAKGRSETELAALIEKHRDAEFAVADLNNDGRLDFEEFTIYYNRMLDLIRSTHAKRRTSLEFAVSGGGKGGRRLSTSKSSTSAAVGGNGIKRREEVVNPESQEEAVKGQQGGAGALKVESAESWAPPVVPKDKATAQMLREAMARHFLFRELDAAKLDVVAAAMFERFSSGASPSARRSCLRAPKPTTGTSSARAPSACTSPWRARWARSGPARSSASWR